MNRLQQRELQRQVPDFHPNATRGLVHSLPTEPSRHASGWGSSVKGTSGRGTSGRGISGRGASGRGTPRRGTCSRGTPGRGTMGRLLPPANSPSSCYSTSTSEVFPAASASGRVGAAGRHFCGITIPENSSTLRVWVSAGCGHWKVSGVCCSGAGAIGYGRGVCSRISWPCAGSMVGS